MEPRGEVEHALDTLSSRTTFGLCFIVVFCIAVTGIMVWFGTTQASQATRLQAVAVETHGSLCALKNDLQRRHDDGVQYLKDHPDGLTSHGETLITAAQIQQSLDNQAATLGALSGLDCDQP